MPSQVSKNLKIYTENNFLKIYVTFHSVQCQRGERWVGGEFISAERIVVYSDDGKAYLYKLPTNCIVESKEFQNRSKTQSGGGRMVIINIIYPDYN